MTSVLFGFGFSYPTRLVDFLERHEYRQNAIILLINTIIATYPIICNINKDIYFINARWFAYEGGAVVFILTLFSVIILGGCTYVVFRTYLRYDEIYSEIEKEEENKRLDKEAKEKAVVEDKKRTENAVAQYGEITKQIRLKGSRFDDRLMVFASSKTIIIYGKVYKFSDILSCSMNDEQRIIKGSATATTTTDTGSMVGRAVVGGVLLGGAGAMIGGSTAKKETMINQEDDTIVHKYTIAISVNDLSNPMVSISTPSLSKANEITALINAVINNK